MSAGQQDRTEGLRTLVIGGSVFICIAVPPLRPSLRSRPVSVPRSTPDLIRGKGAGCPSAHDLSVYITITEHTNKLGEVKKLHTIINELKKNYE